MTVTVPDRFMNNIRTNTILRQESRIKPITGNPHNTGNSIAIIDMAIAQ